MVEVLGVHARSGTGGLRGPWEDRIVAPHRRSDFTITQPPALDVLRYSKLAYVAQTQHLYDIYSMLPDRHLWRYDNYESIPVPAEDEHHPTETGAIDT